MHVTKPKIFLLQNSRSSFLQLGENDGGSKNPILFKCRGNFVIFCFVGMGCAYSPMSLFFLFCLSSKAQGVQVQVILGLLNKVLFQLEKGISFLLKKL